MTVSPLDSASSLLRWSNAIYLVGAALTLLAAMVVLIEKRLVASGRRERTTLLTEFIGVFVAIVSLVGTYGAVHFGDVVSHLKDVDLATARACERSA